MIVFILTLLVCTLGYLLYLKLSNKQDVDDSRYSKKAVKQTEFIKPESFSKENENRYNNTLDELKHEVRNKPINEIAVGDKFFVSDCGPQKKSFQASVISRVEYSSEEDSWVEFECITAENDSCWLEIDVNSNEFSFGWEEKSLDDLNITIDSLYDMRYGDSINYNSGVYILEEACPVTAQNLTLNKSCFLDVFEFENGFKYITVNIDKVDGSPEVYLSYNINSNQIIINN